MQNDNYFLKELALPYPDELGRK